MSQPAPVLVVSDGNTAWATALSGIRAFPLIETSWGSAAEAIDRVHPAAVLAIDADETTSWFDAVATKIATIQPYVPFIAINLKTPHQFSNAIPFSAADGSVARLEARLSAALRVRTLHDTVLRRSSNDNAAGQNHAIGDPLGDATVLLIGRGVSYPTLSIALGEQMGVVGALSIEAAAKHLNGRDLDGVVIGEGFSHRVIDAFLAVLSEDSRFRTLPVILTGSAAPFVSAPDLPNLEIVAGGAADVAASAVPLIRQHAFESYLGRALKSLDAGGLLDARTGLLTTTAFDRDFSKAIDEALARGSSLSAARFVLDATPDRIKFDASRILSRLMRRMDFATLSDDGSILLVFADTDLRTTHMIARRLASVVKHTLHGLARERRVEPNVTLVTLLPNDSAATLLARLHGEGQRAAC